MIYKININIEVFFLDLLESVNVLIDISEKRLFI